MPTLLDGAPANELIADKAYDANATLVLLEARGITGGVPSRTNRKAPRRYAPGVYEACHFVANWFAAFNEFRGIAAGYCMRTLQCGGLLNLASTTFVAFREAVSRRPPGGRPAVNRRLVL